MRDNIHHIHPDYEMLEDIFDYRAGAREAKEKYLLDDIRNKVDLLRAKPKWILPKYLWHFVAFYIVSISSLYLLLDKSPNPKAVPVIPFPIPTEEQKIQEESQDIEGEITLIKEVLTNLTLTVEGLSKQKEAKKEEETIIEEFKPSLIKVTSPKAHLRELPTVDSNPLAVVLKDTTLMGVGYQDDWIKTYAPSGKEAWVHLYCALYDLTGTLDSYVIVRLVVSLSP
jgi:hypothetical protein